MLEHSFSSYFHFLYALVGLSLHVKSLYMHVGAYMFWRLTPEQKIESTTEKTFIRKSDVKLASEVVQH